MLAMIIRSFSVQLAPVWPLLRVTLKPAGSLPMVVCGNR